MASVTAINPAAARPSWAHRAGQLVDTWRRRSIAVTTAVKHSRTSIANSVLQVGGLGCIDVAAFQVSSPLGWFVAGVEAFVLAWLIQPAAGEP